MINGINSTFHHHIVTELRSETESLREQLNPENEPSHYYIGKILQNQGRYHESLESYKRAISLRPDEAFYYYMASQIYTLLEESKEAIEMIDKAIVLSPSDITYQKMKEHILRAFGIEQDLVDLALEK